MKFVLVLCLLSAALPIVAAPAAPAKKKASAPAAASSAKKSSTPSRKGAAKATYSRGRKPTASSKAIYSRSNSRRGRAGSSRVAAAKPQSNWQARPSPERYIEIQQSLAGKGFFKGEANGTWGADSVAALKDFQRSQNLEPDGKLGSLSLIALGMGPKRIVASADTPSLPVPPAAQAPSAVAAEAARQQE